jgi:hypothetical protein
MQAHRQAAVVWSAGQLPAAQQKTMLVFSSGMSIVSRAHDRYRPMVLMDTTALKAVDELSMGRPSRNARQTMSQTASSGVCVNSLMELHRRWKGMPPSREKLYSILRTKLPDQARHAHDMHAQQPLTRPVLDTRMQATGMGMLLGRVGLYAGAELLRSRTWSWR